MYKEIKDININHVNDKVVGTKLYATKTLDRIKREGRREGENLHEF